MHAIDRLRQHGHLIVLIALWVAGCGNQGRTPVSGTLTTADGSPLVGARVTVRSSESGAWATATTDAAGRFELTEAEQKGVPSGRYYVTIVEDLGDWDHPRRPSIHKKYDNAATSQLELVVDGGEKITWNLKLDSP